MTSALSHEHDSTTSAVHFDASTITQPDPALLRYYFVVALLTVAGFPFAI